VTIHIPTPNLGRVPPLVAVGLAAILILCAATPALAQDTDSEVARVEALSAEGATLFRTGSYEEAISQFKEAYSLVPVANLLYNIALSYERLDNAEKASRYYEMFIVADDADPQVRATALRRLKGLERGRRDALVLAALPADPNPRPVGHSTRRTSAWTTAGIISTALGVALASTGVVFALFAAVEQDKFNDSSTLLGKATAQSAAENNALTADVMFAAGATALIVGVTMILVDSSNSDDTMERSIRFTPALGNDKLGAALVVSF
jgi:tetratricopeptide (TPR) repeat protein